jgi:inhibitor of cysteine peptidase
MLHNIGINDSGQTIYTSAGDTIQLQLEENPTTGYSWAIDSVAPFFSLQQNDYHLLSGAGIGGGGTRTIVFKIEQSGSGNISLKNRQPWSDDVYQTFEIAVKAV